MTVKVKICGITNLEDAQTAVQCGADVLGFNFYERSPRYIRPEFAKKIIQRLPAEVGKVGVFVKAAVGDIEKACSISGVGEVQLHGGETPSFVEEVVKVCRARVMKVLHVNTDFDASIALSYQVDAFLLDTYVSDFGGSGKTFDWSIASGFGKLFPKFYLAGGLTPENVADAVRTVRPFGVDVCSGVEVEKGKKVRAKVEAFIRNAKSAI
ncbi:MAG TPA: phosphoribosylanthranilate isomerase [Pyrinomonadaceae bacterium]